MSTGWMALGAGRWSMGFLVYMLGVGCGGRTAIKSSELPKTTTVELAGADPMCAKEGFLCEPKGLAFAQVALGVSDTCDRLIGDCPNPPPGSTTGKLTQPESGKICMAGSVKPGGWAALVLAFTVYDPAGTKVLKKFDADARGITQAAFTLDSPPSGGVKLEAAVVTQLECAANQMDCFTYGFRFLPANTAAPMSFSEPGPHVAPLTHFKQMRTGVSQIFDTTALHNMSFGVGSGPYDFCIHDFRFLDAAGKEVKP
jgi:hypothetical protein